MYVYKTKKELRSHLGSIGAKTGQIGLVPTMGALHAGHLAIIERSLSENKVVVVSIFVNPTQFNNPEDLRNYPKTLDRDLALLRGLRKELVVFAPEIEEMYSGEVRSSEYNFDGLDLHMEGEARPGHFNGVGTVVEALLRLVNPDRAYFGEKDFQQLQIIRKLVKNQGLGVQIIGYPIVREQNGLAMSSRNERLNDRMRKEAAFIYKMLRAAKIKFGTKSAKYVLNWAQNQFLRHPELQLEYMEITDAETLKPVGRKQKQKQYRAFIAVHAGEVRLIDNIALN